MDINTPVFETCMNQYEQNRQLSVWMLASGPARLTVLETRREVERAEQRQRAWTELEQSVGRPSPTPTPPSHTSALPDCPMDPDLINFLSNPPGGENSFGFDEAESASVAFSADAQPEVPDGTGAGPSEGEFDHEERVHALKQFPETARQQISTGGPNAASHMRCVRLVALPRWLRAQGRLQTKIGHPGRPDRGARVTRPSESRRLGTAHRHGLAAGLIGPSLSSGSQKPLHRAVRFRCFRLRSLRFLAPLVALLASACLSGGVVSRDLALYCIPHRSCLTSILPSVSLFSSRREPRLAATWLA